MVLSGQAAGSTVATLVSQNNVCSLGTIGLLFGGRAVVCTRYTLIVMSASREEMLAEIRKFVTANNGLIPESGVSARRRE